MTREEVRAIAEEVVLLTNMQQRGEMQVLIAQTVTETMLRLGVDTKDPVEVQKDMQHLRSWRKSVDKVQEKGLLTMAAVLTTGLIAALWLGIQQALHR